MGGEDLGGLPDLDPDLSKSRGGLPDPDLSKNWGGLPDPVPTRPDPIFVGILSPSRYLAHDCTECSQKMEPFLLSYC